MGAGLSDHYGSQTNISLSSVLVLWRTQEIGPAALNHREIFDKVEYWRLEIVMLFGKVNGTKQSFSHAPGSNDSSVETCPSQ